MKIFYTNACSVFITIELFFSYRFCDVDDEGIVYTKDGPLEVLLGGGLAGSGQRLAGTSRVVDQVRPLVAVVVSTHTLPFRISAIKLS
jgi:hypothetical protein